VYKRGEQQMIIINYLIMCLIFGTTFLAIKIGVDAHLPPFFSAGSRFLVAGLLIFLWMLWKRKVSLSLLLRTEFMLIGLSSTFMTFSTLYWAEQHITSGIAAMLTATGPIMILGMQTVFLRQAITRKAIFGCSLGFLGVFLLILPSLAIEHNLIWAISCILVLIGEIGYAAGTLYSRKILLRVKEISPISVNAIQMMYGGAGMLLLSLLTERFHPESIDILSASSSFLYLIVVGSMLGHSLYYWLLAKTNAVFPSTWLYVSPVIALSVGALWYNEIITLSSMLGAALTLTGIMIANLDDLRALITRRSLKNNIRIM
jgi:drug/metabolite transporter (DMT)-like permease